MTYRVPPLRRPGTPPDYLVLLFLVAALPVSEALKNIGLALYVVLWPLMRYRSGRWGGPWRPLDSVLVTYLGLWGLSTLAVVVDGIDGSGLVAEVKYVALFWLITRSGYSSAQLARLLYVLVLATAVGLAIALYWRETKELTGYLYLPSAPSHGDTNIFLLMVLVLWLTWVLRKHSSMSTQWRGASYLALFLFAYGLMEMQSRTSVALLVLSMLIIAFSWARLNLRRLVRVGAVFSLGLAFIFVAAPATLSKFVERYDNYGWSDPRIDIARTAWLAWTQRPVFGYGAGNFKTVAMAELREKHGDDPSYRWLFLEAKDAHNLYLDTLVQGGLAAFLGLCLVLGVWLRQLISTFSYAGMDDLGWTLWTASASLFAISLAGGMTNHLLRGEPALLIALVLGIWVAHGQRQIQLRFHQASTPV